MSSNRIAFSRHVRVIYIPTHAEGNVDHPDCEHGAVSSVNHFGDVFVRFDKQVEKLGWAGATSQCCNAYNLQLEGPE